MLRVSFVILLACFLIPETYQEPVIIPDGFEQYLAIFREYFPDFKIPLLINDCAKKLLELSVSAEKGEYWALKMLDSSAKPQHGLLWGNFMQIGSYDECLSVQEAEISGKYCTAPFKAHPKYGQSFERFMQKLNGANESDKSLVSTPLAELRMSYGFCVPHVCSAENLQQIFITLEDLLLSPIAFNFNEDYCYTSEKKPFTFASIFAIVIFAVFASLLFLSTVAHVVFFRTKKITATKYVLIRAFSMYENLAKIINAKSDEDSLKCLNGIRVISLIWVVLGHRFLYALALPQINTFEILRWKDEVQNAFILSAPCAVDTFFSVSGVLLAYVFLKKYEHGETVSIPMFYVHRILRLTPALAMVVLFQATLIDYMGNGPLWPVIHGIFQKNCEENWWATLLYIQNYINTDKTCVGVSWYLAVDTQLYFLSPLILFPLTKRPKTTIYILIVLSTISCVYVFAISVIKNLSLAFVSADTNTQDIIYFPTHARITPFFFGIICGYFIYRQRLKSPMIFSRIWAIVLWSISIFLILGVIFTHTVLMRDPNDTILNFAIFNAISRPIWSLAVCTTIVLCTNNCGGIVNSILSHDIFTVLIRFNYSIYLLHTQTIIIFSAQERGSIFFDNTYLLTHLCSDYLYTLLISIIWTVSFESPVITIEKLLLK